MIWGLVNSFKENSLFFLQDILGFRVELEIQGLAIIERDNLLHLKRIGPFG